MKRSFFAILSIASMLPAAANFAVAQERVQAGTLVCHTSIELGVILGSQEALSCRSAPRIPGNQPRHKEPTTAPPSSKATRR